MVRDWYRGQQQRGDGGDLLSGYVDRVRDEDLGYLGLIFVVWRNTQVLPWSSLYEAPAHVARGLMYLLSEIKGDKA